MANEQEEFEFRYRLEQEQAAATESPSKPTETLPQAIGTVAGRAAIGGAESALNLEQNAANLVGKSLNSSLLGQLISYARGKDISVAQWYGDEAKSLKDFKNKNYPEGDISSSVGGRVLEGLLRAPEMIAEIGTGGAALKGMGVASKVAQGIGAFSAIGGINKQAQGPVAMAEGAIKGAVEGALFHAASGLKLIPRMGAGAAISTGSAALEGAKGDDLVVAGATGGAFSAMQPGVGQEVADLAGDVSRPVVQGAKAVGKAAQYVGGVMARTPDNLKEFVNVIKEGKAAGRELKNIQSGIRSTQAQVADTRDSITQEKWAAEDEQAALSKQKIQRDKELSQAKAQGEAGIDELNLSDAAKKELHAVAKGKIKSEQELAEAQVKASVEDQSRKISLLIDNHEQGRVTDAISMAKGLKSGKIQQFFRDISSAYEIASNKIFDYIDQKSPVTTKDVQAMLDEKAADIISNGSLDSPVLKQIHAEKKRLDNSGKRVSAVEQALNSKIEEARLQREAQYPGSTKPPVEKMVPYRQVRQMVQRIKSADAYGSHDSDVISHGFLELTNDLIRNSGGSPDATLSFEKLQSQMSEAISNKAKLLRMFGIKGGAANWEKAANALLDLYNEKGMTAPERVANRANKEAIAYLEKGDTLAKGIGDISSGLQKRAEKLQFLEEHYKKINDSDKGQIIQVAKAYNDKIAAIEHQGKLDSKTLSRETEAFQHEMMVKAAEIDMKYELANRALEKSVAGRKEVVKRGENFILEKGKEIRTQSELARVKHEAVVRRREHLGFVRAVAYSMGAFGMWKFGRVAQAGAGMARYDE